MTTFSDRRLLAIQPQTYQALDEDSYDPVTRSTSTRRMPCGWCTRFSPPNNARSPELVSQNVAEICRKVIIGESPWPLFLWGDVGSGKTSAALVIGDWAGNCAYSDVSTFVRRMNAADRGEENDLGVVRSVYELRHEWSRAHICVLDELGTREKSSDYQYEQVKWAIDSRCAECKPLIIVSNCSGPELGKVYDDRIVSRCAQGTIVKCTGDRRIK